MQAKALQRLKQSQQVLDRIDAELNGRGVDIALNSLTGEFITKGARSVEQPWWKFW